jgi:hypothetical protein
MENDWTITAPSNKYDLWIKKHLISKGGQAFLCTMKAIKRRVPPIIWRLIALDHFLLQLNYSNSIIQD